MQVKVSKSEGLTHELEVSIAASEIDGPVADRLREIGKTVKLKGFRKGRIPPRILKSRYGPSVRGEILRDTVSESSAQAMQDENIKPAMQPQIEIVQSGEGEDLVYTLSVISMPELELADCSGIELTRLVSEPGAEQVEERIARLHESFLASQSGEDGDELSAIDDAFAAVLGLDALRRRAPRSNGSRSIRAHS